MPVYAGKAKKKQCLLVIQMLRRVVHIFVLFLFFCITYCLYYAMRIHHVSPSNIDSSTINTYSAG